MLKRFFNWLFNRKPVVPAAKQEPEIYPVIKSNPMFSHGPQQMAMPSKAYQHPAPPPAPRPPAPMAPPPPPAWSTYRQPPVNRAASSSSSRSSSYNQPTREVHHHHTRDDTDYVTPIVTGVVMGSILSDDTPSRSSSNDRCDYGSRNDYSDSSSSSSCDSSSD